MQKMSEKWAMQWPQGSMARQFFSIFSFFFVSEKPSESFFFSFQSKEYSSKIKR